MNVNSPSAFRVNSNLQNRFQSSKVFIKFHNREFSNSWWSMHFSIPVLRHLIIQLQYAILLSMFHHDDKFPAGSEINLHPACYSSSKQVEIMIIHLISRWFQSGSGVTRICWCLAIFFSSELFSILKLTTIFIHVCMGLPVIYLISMQVLWFSNKCSCFLWQFSEAIIR